MLAFCPPHLLADQESKLGVRIINQAESGAMAADVLGKCPLIIRSKPDVLLLSCGANDAYCGIDLAAYLADMRRIIRCFSKNLPIVLVPPLPVDTIRFGLEGRKFNQLIRPFNRACLTLAGQFEHLRAIDTWPLFSDLLKKGVDYHIEDGVHLNNIGYETLFTALAALLPHHDQA